MSERDSRRIRPWPEGRRFAFTIVDDTDHASVENVRPVYDLLRELGLRTTKTVWVLDAPPGSRWHSGQSLTDTHYRRFVLSLKSQGFEIALHGVRGDDSTREDVRRGLDEFRRILGGPPRVHVNHAHNRDNLYSGTARLHALRRRLRLHRRDAYRSEGQDPGSPYFWGDWCRADVDYVRGLEFQGTNTLRGDPFMPYRLDRCPYVKAWFSCSNGARRDSFLRLLSSPRQERLERERGLCIVYTHFGTPGFVTSDGRVDPDVRRTLEELSRRPGWFQPASVILDHLRAEPVPTLGIRGQLSLFHRHQLDRRMRHV